MHATEQAHRKVKLSLAAIVGSLALLLAVPALSQAEESNPNNYNCVGGLAAGTPEEGSEDQQVAYHFYCNGPITGYQLESNVPVTGAPAAPLVSTIEAGVKVGPQLKDTFSCGGEFPGWAVNCVGTAKSGYEMISGQFAQERKLCVEPRVDVLLSVTFATIEKGAVVQAISGPFELGRPLGCRVDAYSGYTRLNPKPVTGKSKKHGKKHKKSTKKLTKKSAKKAAHRPVHH